MRKRALIVVAISSLMGVLACEAVDDGADWTMDPKEASDPSGNRPLTTLTSQQQVEAAVFGAWNAVAVQRKAGMELMISELKKALQAKGIDTTALDKIDETIMEQDLPNALNSASSSPSSDGIGSSAQGLTGGYSQYYDCPILAPGQNLATTCTSLISSIVSQVTQQVAQNKQVMADQVKKVYGSLTQEAQNFITAWGQAAKQHGAEVAAVYAEAELRAAAKCDDTSNGMQVSYVLGVEQGQKIVLELKAWAMSQVAACVVNTDEIVKSVEVQALAKIDAYMKAHAVCKDSDISDTSSVFKNAEIKRKEGIVAGIKQQVTVLKTELFNYRATVPCDGLCMPEGAVKGGDCYLNLYSAGTTSGSYKGWWVEKAGQYKVCCRKQNMSKKLRCVGTRLTDNKTIWCQQNNDASCISCQDKYIYIGSPVVIDLDGDGMVLSSSKVRFDLLADGAPQQVTWVGPTEGIVALDRNGNGKVDSGAELFGDRSDCGTQRCYDGVDALARLDSNGDGLVGRGDAAYGRLMVWTDRNQNGVSEASELRTLEQAGVLAINTSGAERNARRLQGASLTSRLSVLTEAGFRSAYDLWFDMDIAPANLKSFMPN